MDQLVHDGCQKHFAGIVTLGLTEEHRDVSRTTWIDPGFDPLGVQALLHEP